ncbi:GntR family transcriptional regulator [Nonomuraea glycinis]|uniref:GntR family transcriptional regulator n=1 Tax=Nonomuraea glycinis TaxID=2047744 RepID=UPI0016665879|nr:GntR family transcriptional regulator [Nonomuraea glycinis]MCA2175810.1 GntR family transcriptional regulator [Nonomuraea glycinis]
MTDYSSGMPVYRQVAIREALQHQLVEEFGIAPNTAQKVLTRLRQEGAAYAVRGVGTFVRSDEALQDD